MKSYNGFTPHQRNQAQGWLRKMWGSGRLEPPVQCVACGQTEGPVHAHAEDYSLPYAPGKTDEYHLCFTCHMMVHCRFSNRERWDYYRGKVRDGFRFAAHKSWPAFMGEFLSTKEPQPVASRAAPERHPLDEIDQRVLR